MTASTATPIIADREPASMCYQCGNLRTLNHQPPYSFDGNYRWHSGPCPSCCPEKTCQTCQQVADDSREQPPFVTALHARARVLAAQWAAEYPQLCPKRLERAAELVSRRTVVPYPGKRNGRVESDNGRVHYVQDGQCDCLDALNRGPLCKHRLALALERALVPSR